MKRIMIESAKKFGGSVGGGGENAKKMWWNDQLKAAVKRKDTAWKEVIGTRDEGAKERCMEVYK